mgnify:CR=1 FL=1
MPRRSDIESILILGAGPIVIGQACEFDYSGAQACKALREEGYRVILVNSNPATIMTDPAMADATYIEPVEWQTVARIIERERPDAVLPTMGGQTALNCALKLASEGVLEKFGVEMIGATQEAIDKAEDREKFDVAMRRIGLETPRAGLAHSMEEAWQVHEEIGFPCIVKAPDSSGSRGVVKASGEEDVAAAYEEARRWSRVGLVLVEEFISGHEIGAQAFSLGGRCRSVLGRCGCQRTAERRVHKYTRTGVHGAVRNALCEAVALSNMVATAEPANVVPGHTRPGKHLTADIAVRLANGQVYAVGARQDVLRGKTSRAEASADRCMMTLASRISSGGKGET